MIIMNDRLTNKKEYGKYFPKYDENGNEIYCQEDYWQKLGKYEDIEEKIGCPIEVIFKAILYGFYSKDYQGKIVYCGLEDTSLLYDYDYDNEKDEFTNFRLVIGNQHENFDIKDYKKTWWLKETREE